MRSKLFILSVLLVSWSNLFAESPALFRVMSYNVENLFHPSKDSVKNDGDFTPEGAYHWGYNRYKQKIAMLGKVIVALGEGNPPALIGLCEIENRQVLNDLTGSKSVLENFHYSIVHQESPDARGVDVALLYQPKMFRLLSTQFLPVKNERMRQSRDILYATGAVPSGDTLHVFVNHWPSRRGNELGTERNRIFAASIVREKVDSIFQNSQHPSVIVMGDFNDYPDNRSIAETLHANPIKKDMNVCPVEMYNLFYKYHENRLIGTYKFQGEWNVLDQIMVSGSLLLSDTFYTNLDEEAVIYQKPFLFENGEVGSNSAPSRTYQGQKYMGGISDHLPIYVNFYYKKQNQKK